MKATEEQISQFVAALRDLQNGKVVIATVDGVRVPVTRLYFGVECVSGPLKDYDSLESFETVEEARSFIQGNSIEPIDVANV